MLIVDPNKLVRDVNPMTFALNTGESADLTLNLEAPAGRKTADESLVITVQRTANSQTNFASIETTMLAP